ncbi:MAG TPA: polysaccharide deacetylase family protein [Nitrospirales bacterium]|nr:polysaccharide deacetylase family protein [Nitrospirales bacterium]
MTIRHFKRSFEKNRNELLGLGLGRYPLFVRSDVQPEQIPVFQFHDVSTATLQPILEFIARNDYVTLTGDEYYERTVGASPRGDREVLLTFDDGQASLYTVAFPLLDKFKQRAVAYIVPGRVPDGVTNLSGNDLDSALCSWPQIREMHSSGVIDFQSHSLYHHSIAISPTVVDFKRPGLSTSFLESDLAPIHQQTLDSSRTELHNFWGSPIYQWNARMCANPAFIENVQIEDLCVRYVADHGGQEFFYDRDWRRQLKQIIKNAQGKCAPIEFETADEQRNAILTDLCRSKAAIEANLPGSRVRHFCFPWYRGSALAAELSLEAGYVTNAWGSLLPQFVDKDEIQPLPIPRLQPKYIYRLPGVGRRPLWRLFGGAM